MQLRHWKAGLVALLLVGSVSGRAYGQAIVPLEPEDEETTETTDESVLIPFAPEEPASPTEPLPGEGPGFFPDPEVFSNPDSLPGPIPPPPTVTPSFGPGTKFTEVSADFIVQDRVNDLTTLEGNVVVVYEDTIIRSQQGTIDDQQEEAHFWGEGGVEAENDEGILNCLDLRMEYAEDVKKLTATGEVDALLHAKDFGPLPEKPTRREKMRRAIQERATTLKGDNLDYWWGTKEFHLWVTTGERAEILQDGRTAKARDIHYHKTPEELMTLTDTVELWQSDGLWLYAHDLIENKDSKVLKALMSVPSTVTCATLTHNETTKLSLFEGDVYLVQADKDAHAETLIIDDSPRAWVDPSDNPPRMVFVGEGVETIEPEDVLSSGITFGPPLPDPTAEPSEDPEVPTNETYGGQTLIAEGGVYAHQLNGDWLFTYEVIEPDENEKVKADARREAEGWAERVVFRLDTEDLEAQGNVRVRQPHQWGRADAIEYEKEADRLDLAGDVRIRRRDKQTVLADEGTLWLTSDVFEGRGNVESMLIVDTDTQEPSDIEGGVTLSGFPGGSAHPDLADPMAEEGSANEVPAEEPSAEPSEEESEKTSEESSEESSAEGEESGEGEAEVDS